MPHTLYIVVPCYNEQEVLPETAKRLKAKMEELRAAGRVTAQSRVCFVNDGSKDTTWELMQALHASDPVFACINLSRNRGHQNALLAGLMTVKDQADCVVTMDADLQDDIEAVDRFLDAYEGGADVVYGVRASRKTDSFFKRFTAEGFYRFMGMMGVDIVYNHADYRLMSRRALDALAQFKEVNLFLRGILPLIGFPSANVYYERHERFAGKTKYPLKRMLALAFDGIISFSVKPIRVIGAAGVTLFTLSAVYLLFLLIWLLCAHPVEGWMWLMGAVCLFGGLEMLGLGVIGEYVGRVYQEVKERPRFLIESYLNQEKDK